MAFPAISQQGRRIRKMTLKAAETFKEGAALVITTGEVLEAADAAGAVGFIGFADEDAVPDGIDVHPGEALVAVGAPGSTFFMEIWASAARVEPAITDLNIPYGIAKDAANGAWYVNRDDTTNDAVVVVDILPKDAIPQQDGAGSAFIESLVEVKLLTPYG